MLQLTKPWGRLHLNCAFFSFGYCLTFFDTVSITCFSIQCLLFEWKKSNLMMQLQTIRYYHSNEREVTKSQWHKNPQFYNYNWNGSSFLSAFVIFKWRGKKKKNGSRRNGNFLTKPTNDKARKENQKTFLTGTSV